LQETAEKKHAEAGRRDRADRTEQIADQRNENDRPPAERIGKRAVKQHHESKAEKIDGQGLLRRRRRHVQILGDGGQRREIGVDGKRPHHGKSGQDENEEAVIQGFAP
jgi:hypothetical protein